MRSSHLCTKQNQNTCIRKAEAGLLVQTLESTADDDGDPQSCIPLPHPAIRRSCFAIARESTHATDTIGPDFHLPGGLKGELSLTARLSDALTLCTKPTHRRLLQHFADNLPYTLIQACRKTCPLCLSLPRCRRLWLPCRYDERQAFACGYKYPSRCSDPR